MSITLEINGALKLNIFNLDTLESVSEEKEVKILSKLQSGHFVIGLEKQMIYKTSSLSPKYGFTFDVQDYTEYEFTENE